MTSTFTPPVPLSGALTTFVAPDSQPTVGDMVYFAKMAGRCRIAMQITVRGLLYAHAYDDWTCPASFRTPVSRCGSRQNGIQ